jgi:hypothetical protein
MTMMGPYFLVFAVVGIAIFAFSIFVQWRIFSKAGYSGALSLLNLLLIIPIINLIGIFIVCGLWIWFAFAEWPVQREAKGMGAAKTMS